MMNVANTKELLEVAFKKVDRKVNTILFLFLGLMIPISFVYEGSSIECWQLDTLLVSVFMGAIVFLIRYTVIEKKVICIQCGLVCPHCGKTPKALLALPSLEKDICFRCNKEMNLNEPNQGMEPTR